MLGSHRELYHFYTLLLLSRFSCVRLCATLETAAHQAPPSHGQRSLAGYRPCGHSQSDMTE